MQAGSKGRAWRTWAASRLEHQLFLAFCARVVKRMLSSAAARAVHSWLAFVEQRRRALRLLRKAGARFVATTLAGMFARWNRHGVESRTSLARLHRAVGALVQRGQRLAFSTWQEHAYEAAEHDRLLRRALARMRAIGITRAWTSWAALALQRREVLDGLRRMLARWSHKHLGAGWAAWTMLMAAAQCKSNAMLRAADHLAARGQISRAKALSHWREQVAARMAVARKASQWVNRDGARAWHAWAAVAAERRHVQEVLHGALRELGPPREEKAMRVAWRTWAPMAQEAAAARAEARAEAEEAGRAAELDRRFARAVSARASLLAAWRWWHHRAIALAASRMHTRAQTYMWQLSGSPKLLAPHAQQGRLGGATACCPRRMGRNDAGLSCATPPLPPVPHFPRGGAPQPLRPVPACATAHLCPRDPFCISQHPGCARTNRSRAARPRCGSTQWSRAASHHTSRGRPANTAMNAFSAPVQAACTCSQSTRRVMIVLCLAPSLSILRPCRIFYHRMFDSVHVLHPCRQDGADSEKRND